MYELVLQLVTLFSTPLEHRDKCDMCVDVCCRIHYLYVSRRTRFQKNVSFSSIFALLLNYAYSEKKKVALVFPMFAERHLDSNQPFIQLDRFTREVFTNFGERLLDSN